MRLEPELWDMLAEICDREAQDMGTMVRQIDAAGHSGGRTSAVRVYIANYFHTAATEIGHASCGHGKPAEPPSNRPPGRRTLIMAQTPAGLVHTADLH